MHKKGEEESAAACANSAFCAENREARQISSKATRPTGPRIGSLVEPHL